MDKYEREAIAKRELAAHRERVKKIIEPGRKRLIKMVQEIFGPVKVHGQECEIIFCPPACKCHYKIFSLQREYGKRAFISIREMMDIDKVLQLIPVLMEYKAILNAIDLDDELKSIRIKNLTGEGGSDEGA